MAPLTPFLAEEIYKNLTGEESVHLKDWPKKSSELEVEGLELIDNMETVRKICELGHAERKKLGIKVRQPLGQCQVIDAELPIAGDLQQLIRDELNVKEIVVKVGKGELKVELDSEITPELKAEGEARDFIRKIQELRKEKNCRIDEEITIYAPSWPKEYEAYIKEQTLAKKILCSEFLKISTG